MKFAGVKFDKFSIFVVFFFILFVVYVAKMEGVDIKLFERVIELIAMDMWEDIRQFIYIINRFFPILFDLYGLRA